MIMEMVLQSRLALIPLHSTYINIVFARHIEICKMIQIHAVWITRPLSNMTSYIENTPLLD